MNSTKLSTLDSTTTSSNTELSGRDTDQKKTKFGTAPKTSTMQRMQSESFTNDLQNIPDWEKVERAAPAPLGPQDGWGDSSAIYCPFPPTSPGYSGASKKEVEHAGMSWTACYDDGCFVHLSEKQGRWFPKKSKKHTIKKNLPYATPASPPSPPPHQPPKPKHGNTREMHAKRVSWDKCNKKECKAHKEEKRRNRTV